MKIFFNLMSIVIVTIVIILGYLNSQTVFDFAFWQEMNNNQLLIFNVNLFQIMLLTFIAGLITGIFWSVAFYLPKQNKLKEYQRKLEKTSVQSDEESSKVAVLEEKIKTLEKALESALENKEQE